MSNTAETSATVLTRNWAAPEERSEQLATIVQQRKVKKGKFPQIPLEIAQLVAIDAWNGIVENEKTYKVPFAHQTQFMFYCTKIASGKETVQKNAVAFTIPVIDGTLAPFFDRWIRCDFGVFETEGYKPPYTRQRWVGDVCVIDFVGNLAVEHEGHVDVKTGLSVPVFYSALDIWMMNKLIPDGIDLILKSLGLDPADYRCIPLSGKRFVIYSTVKEIDSKEANFVLESLEGVEDLEATEEFRTGADKEFIATCERRGAARKAKKPYRGAGQTRKGAGEKPRRNAGEGSNSRQSAAGPSRATRGAK